MSRFTALDTPLSGLKVIERQQLGDSRGFFSRIFCSQELGAAGWDKPVVQINQTLTHDRGNIRGLHFQLPPHIEMKLVTCLRGKIFDVVVDLRAGSPTFLHWHAEELSAVNQRALLIPEGFAHGFQALEPDCQLIYLHSAAYSPESEAGLNPLDPMLSINWPLPITEMSKKDSQNLMLNHQFQGVVL